MYTLFFSAHFERKTKKLIKQRPTVKKPLEKALSLLRQNPQAQPLKTHQALAKVDGKPARSSFVTKDLRIIWRFDRDQIRLINLIDIGGHGGKRKVYK